MHLTFLMLLRVGADQLFYYLPFLLAGPTPGWRTLIQGTKAACEVLVMPRVHCSPSSAITFVSKPGANPYLLLQTDRASLRVVSQAFTSVRWIRCIPQFNSSNTLQ